MKRYFVTGTGTGIGKSYITACLIKQARAMGKSVAAFKPVISGWDADQIATSDTGTILDALGLPATPENIGRISPWRYAAPLAPAMAARLENRPLDFDAIAAHSRDATQGAEEIILIEGVGGVMVPLTDDKTVLEWITAAKLPVLLVAGSYLGTISHTLTALEALRTRGLTPAAIILSESEDAAVSLADTYSEISRWSKLPTLAVARRDAGGELRQLLG